MQKLDKIKSYETLLRIFLYYTNFVLHKRNIYIL